MFELLTAREELDTADLFVGAWQAIDDATTELVGDERFTNLVADCNQGALLVDVTSCDSLAKYRT